jgi:effector-binding domain-containing protein
MQPMSVQTMITEPRLENRAGQHYVAIRTRVAIPFGTLLPPMWDEVSLWLAKNGLATAGAPFIRYLTTDMEKKLDIEVGFPVAAASTGRGRISAGCLPPGRYAVLTYTGPYEGNGVFNANVAMLEWAKENNIAWQITTKDNVEWWGARLEYYLTNPESEPDTRKYRTELAFLIDET